MNYTEIPEGQILVLCPPNIMGMMSGVDHVEQDRSGRVCLVYEDGTRESGTLPEALRDIENVGFLDIVSAIQAQRTAER